MRAFDPDDYRRRVLASLHRRGGAEHSDPFEIYDIALDSVDTLDDGAVRDRIAEVWAFWQRGRDHPRYRGVILGLLERHAELSASLAERTSRLALRDRVAAARAERDDERFAELDAAARRLVARFGGLPEDRIAGLRTWAATQGIDEAEFARRIRRHRVLPARPAGARPDRPRPVPISPAVLRQIRADLDELGRITGAAPPRSLFELLGVAPATPQQRIREVREAALARNRARRPDRRRALLDDLLAAVGALLVDGDPQAYLDALAAAVTERLRPRVAAAVLVEDALLPNEAASLVAAAQADGLDPERARAVVAALAAEHGVSAPPVPAATGGPAAGTGGGDSHPGAPGPASTPDRGHPRGEGPADGPARPTRAADWAAAVSQARAALRGGQPVRADEFVATARELAGETLPPIRAMGDEVEAAIRSAAQQWAALAPLVAAARYHAVMEPARRLAARAADVPGPGGQLPGELLSLAESRCRAAEDLLDRARQAGVDGPAGTRLVEEALVLVSDHPGALALRRPAAAAAAATATAAAAATATGTTATAGTATPGAAALTAAAPPTAVVARREGGSVVVRWQPSPTPGEIRYRVTRVAADGSSRAVGVTTATSLEDGGAPPGTIPAYAVTATAGTGWSESARTSSPDEGGSPDPGGAAEQGTGEAATPGNAADALPPPTGLRWDRGRLRWTWPAGCTEMMVVQRGDGPPSDAGDPLAQARKVTNTRYEIDGGVPLPAARPVHIALFCCARPAGALVVASSAGARLLLPDVPSASAADGGP